MNAFYKDYFQNRKLSKKPKLDLLLKGSIFLLLLIISVGLTGQIMVNGKVTGAGDGLELIGVNIVLKGTSQGAITDASGNYEISVPSAESILIFSYLGYLDQEVTVGNRTVIDVVMAADVAQLDEVVVTGYGVQKKANLSGAVDNISVEQFASRPISNLSQGLQGASPNLNIDFNSGSPGQAPKINIRGLTSINGGEPLVLIDGVPSDASELNRIAPEDVASISVLKDASSAAIYGARAAFGVILITTKTGTGDGINVSYNNNFSFGKPTVLPEKITDPYIFLRVSDIATNNTPWDYNNYNDERYLWAKQRSDNPGSTPGVRESTTSPGSWEYMGNRDWTLYFLNDYTNSHNHNLSISGKSEKTQYYLSGSFNRHNGALSLADDYFDRSGFRGKVNFQISENLSIGNNTYLTTTNRLVPNAFDIRTLYNFWPTEFDKNPDGSWANTGVGREAAQLTDGGTWDNKYNSFQTTFTGELQVIKDLLRVNADFTTRRGTGNLNSFNTKYQIGYGPNDIREEGSNSARRNSSASKYDIFNVYGTLFKNFGGIHEFTAIAGYNQEYFKTENINIFRDGVISSSLPTIALATGDPQVSESIADWAVRGAFYRLNYTLKGKYIFELNGRYDGSSRFPKDKRFGFFPSASVAWNLGREDFVESMGLFSLLKLRASYGSLGNQSVSNYGYIPSISASTGNYIFGDKLGQRVIPPSLVSANYTWEDVTSYNFGLDVGFFDNRLIANFDVYTRDTKGMLTQGKDLPDVLGASEPAENAADLRTKGWELSLEYRNSVEVFGKPMFLNTRLVLSDSRSNITKFDNPNNNLTQFYVGQELGEIWGLTSDGLFQSENEIAALDETSLIPWGALSIVPGWPKFRDLDGNGAIEKGLTTDDPKDLSVIGNFTPRYRFGVNLGVDYGAFDLNVFVQGVGKRDYYPQDYLYWGFYQQPYAGGYEHILDFYRASDDSGGLSQHSQSYIDAGLANANTDSYYPILQAWLADRNLGERVDQSKGLAIPQTRYLLNASYLRLKNITLGYTLPTDLTRKVKISSVRIFISGENIGEFSGVNDFFDPEAISDTDNLYDPGYSPGRGEAKGYAYPFQRRYSFGLSVNF